MIFVCANADVAPSPHSLSAHSHHTHMYIYIHIYDIYIYITCRGGTFLRLLLRMGFHSVSRPTTNRPWPTLAKSGWVRSTCSYSLQFTAQMAKFSTFPPSKDGARRAVLAPGRGKCGSTTATTRLDDPTPSHPPHTHTNTQVDCGGPHRLVDATVTMMFSSLQWCALGGVSSPLTSRTKVPS